MKENCNCDSCKHKVDEYRCFSCGNNFNECETFFEVYESMTGDLPTLPLSQLCPKCHPETWDSSGSYPGFNVVRKDRIDDILETIRKSVLL